MKKPKSAAKLAAEASDKLDQLAIVEEWAIVDMRRKFAVAQAGLHAKFDEKRKAIWDALPEESVMKLRVLRCADISAADYAAMAADLAQGARIAPYELDTIPTDEPTHLRDVQQ